MVKRFVIMPGLLWNRYLCKMLRARSFYVYILMAISGFIIKKIDIFFACVRRRRKQNRINPTSRIALHESFIYTL